MYYVGGGTMFSVIKVVGFFRKLKLRRRTVYVDGETFSNSFEWNFQAYVKSHFAHKSFYLKE